MPIDTKAEYNSLISSDKLDVLLGRAREQAEKISEGAPITTEQAVAQVSEKVSDMGQKSAAARQDLQEILKQRDEERAEKVAAAVHIYRVATKLVS